MGGGYNWPHILQFFQCLNNLIFFFEKEKNVSFSICEYMYIHIYTQMKHGEEWQRLDYSRQQCAKKLKKLRNFKAAGTR